MPFRKDFPSFANTYFDLKKEGLPFKHQFDATRVPVFSPGQNPFAPDSARRGSIDETLTSARMSAGGRSGKDKENGTSQTAKKMQASLAVIVEMITATISSRELKANETLAEVVKQLQEMRPELDETIRKGIANLQVTLTLSKRSTVRFCTFRFLTARYLLVPYLLRGANTPFSLHLWNFLR
jgi:hypothetical protein